ncbi:cobalt ABC transporter permease [Spirochaetia bacterium]|nr:cobalt ABC transporter permease [Spirochaetia bacterium]
MSKFMLSYIERPSFVHKLSGAAKLVVFLLWSVLAMVGYDTRIMLIMAVLGISIFMVSRTKIREISFILKLLFIFMILNLITIYLFAPEQGVAIYGTRHVIREGIGRYSITAEQLFYEFNVALKYFIILPLAVILIVTIQPSEFAASLNRIGIPYSIAYAVSLTLRYIPDVQRDFENISQSQQARGIELSKKLSTGKPVSWVKRIKGFAAILLPLIFSSIDRIDVISHAMELRGFGKNKKRTWYAAKPFSKADILVMAGAVLLFALGCWFTFKDGDRFYNPWG